MKKLLELINFILKKINIIDKKEIINIEEQLIEKTKEDVVINDCIVENINFDLIASLNAFDIVLVKMTDEEIKNCNIMKSHQIRPFLIDNIDNLNQVLSGYYLTSNVDGNRMFNFENNSGLKLVLSKDFYNLKKNSLVLYHEKIDLPYKNVVDRLDHMNKEDLKRLKKYIELISRNIVVSSRGNNIVEVGDIVYFDGFRYIIYQVNDDSCYGYWLKMLNCEADLEKDHHFVKFNNRIYFVQYEYYKTFGNEDELQIIDRFNENIVELIKENRKMSYLEKREKIKKRI